MLGIAVLKHLGVASPIADLCSVPLTEGPAWVFVLPNEIYSTASFSRCHGADLVPTKDVKKKVASEGLDL